MNNITITINGPVKSGKTALATCIANMLQTNGITTMPIDDSPNEAMTPTKASRILDNLGDSITVTINVIRNSR